MRIGIIGGGFMGEAFLRGLLRAEVAAPADVAIAEVIEARRLQLKEHGARVTDDTESACIGADIVLIAVKPQDLPAAVERLRGAIPREALLVSVAMGVTLEDLRRYSGHRASVRVMPNLPAAIGHGATVYYVSPEVTAEQRSRLSAILGAVSSVAVEVSSDDAVDLSTAINGSGPAYVYLFIESLTDAAVRLGMKRADAEKLVLATVSGATQYAIDSGQHPAMLRNAVTSPGGTTAAALAELEGAGLRSAIDAAVEAAYDRAREMGEQS